MSKLIRSLKFYISNFIDYAALALIFFGVIILIISLFYFSYTLFFEAVNNSGDVN